MPVIVSITDAASHDPGCPLCSGGTDYDDNTAVLAVAHLPTETALADICARVVTYADGRYYANSTGALIPPDA